MVVVIFPIVFEVVSVSVVVTDFVEGSADKARVGLLRALLPWPKHFNTGIDKLELKATSTAATTNEHNLLLGPNEVILLFTILVIRKTC